MAISLSHGGPTIYSSDALSQEVLVGTARGIARLVREGDGWRVDGHTLEDKHVGPILIEPESGLIFAGAYHDPRVFISSDGGKTWETRDLAEGVTDVYSIEAVPGVNNPRIYAGTEPARLFYSDDLGASWTELPSLLNVPTDAWTFPAPPHVAHTKHITYDPADPNTLYVSVEQGGLLRSRDAGETFEVVKGMDDDVHRLVLGEKGRMFVTGGDGVYASTDGGERWEHRTTRQHEIGGYPDQLVFKPSDPSTMFIASAKDNPGAWRESHNAEARIARSRDAGQSWQILTAGLPDGLQGNVEAMLIEEAGGACQLLAATTAGEVFASSDGGDSWTIAVEGLAPISKAGHYRALTLSNA